MPYAPDPLLFVLACSTRFRLARQVRFLREENRILRGKLPERVRTTPSERERLIRFGRPLGPALKELISIVRPETFQRWMRGGKMSRSRHRPGPPRKPEEIRALIFRIARESGWGYTRVLGELKKLGINNVSRATVRHILIEHHVNPAPKRPGQSWDAFMKSHAETLWACDFFTKTVWTPLGPRIAHILFFLHIGSRRVIISEPTTHPTHAWWREQAQLFLVHAQEQGFRGPEFLIRDGDGKFGSGFNRVLREAGCTPKRIPPGVPNMNAFAERWVRSVKAECLGHLIAFGTGHMDYLIGEYVAHYHEERPHQGLGNRLIGSRDPPGTGRIHRRTRLGGVLASYEREAA